MKDGIYEATFVVSRGNIVVSAVLIKNNVFVGADGVNFYRGHIERRGDDLNVSMRITRHSLAIFNSAFGMEVEFTIKWRGHLFPGDKFELESVNAGLPETLRVSGKLLTGPHFAGAE